MEKLSLLTINPSVTHYCKRIKALKIFLLGFIFSCISYAGFAQVAVTPATGGTVICSQTAVTGAVPACTTLGVITIAEAGSTGDFSIGADNIVLAPPAGWQFCTGTPPVLAFTAARDIVSIAIGSFTTGSLTINFNVTSNFRLDQITITGLQVQPSTTSPVTTPPGFIYALSETGVAGITTTSSGTDFGDLRLAATSATTYTVTGGGIYCAPGGAGAPVGLSGSDLGLNYQLFDGATLVATLPGTGGPLNFGLQAATGTYTITATNSCGVTVVMSGSALISSGGSIQRILAATPPLHNLCAYYADSERVTDATTGGIWTSDLVTIDTTGMIVPAAAGIATVTYTIANGCAAMIQLTVNPNANITGPDSVCQGSSVTLVDTVLGGVWASSNTTVATVGMYSGIVTGATPGTTIISYINPGGCETTVTVTVNPVPTPIAGILTICQGSNTLLSSGPPGGIWSSGNTSVATVISIGGGDAIVFGVVGTSGSGTSTIVFKLPTGCATLTSVTVDPLPQPILGPTPPTVCLGDSILLTDGTSGGAWSITNTAVATIDPFGNVTGSSPGADTVIYTLPAGHCAATFTVTVNPLPDSILGPDSVCVGSSVHLFDSSTGGNWASSNTSVAFVDGTGFVTGIGPGTATITYTLVTGCSTTVTITVNGLPTSILSFTEANTMCVDGPPLILYDLTGGGVWSVSDPTIADIIYTSANGDTINLGGVAAGSVVVTYTLGAGGCLTTFDVTVNPIPPIPVGPAIMCQGDTVTFTDTEPGGTWSVSNTSIATIDSLTGFVTAISSGVITVTYTGTGSCSRVVSLNIKPVDPIGGNTVFCEGSVDTLINANLLGTWSSSNTSVASIVSSSVGGGTVIILGVSGGTAIITYTSVSGCPSYLQITVDAISPLAGGPPVDYICVNDSFSLMDVYGPGNWSSSNTSVATVTTGGEVYGLSSGVATITYTIPTSGCSVTYTFTVNAIPDPITGIDSVCVGRTGTLSDDIGGGDWLTSSIAIATITPGPGSPATFGGVSGGVANITYTLPDGCSAYVQVTVEPSSRIFGLDSSVCVLGSISLVDTTVGGIWSSSNTGIAIVSPAGVVTGVSAGVVTINYFLPTGGCSQSITITVNPLPSPITGIDSVCVGSHTTLTDTSAGGTGTWSSFNNSIATVDSGVVGGVFGGVDVITYTLPRTGCLITTLVTVDPLPTPIYGTDSFMCAGDSIHLHDTSAGGVWTSTNTGVATVSNSGTVYGLPGPGGDAVINYTLLTGGCPEFLTVTVYPIPNITIASTPNPPVVCKGAVVLLDASGAGPSGTYAWSPSYALTSIDSASPTASPTITTTYEVIGTTRWGCRDSAFITVTVDSMLNHLKIVGVDSVCEGACDTLKASGNPEALFSWHPSIGLSVTVGDTIVACPTTTTTYEAVAIDAMGCIDSASFTVGVNPIPNIIVTSPALPVIVCRGVPTQIVVSTTNTNNNTTTYAWSPDILISCDSCSLPYVTDTFNLVYRVIATSIYGCYDSLNIKVSVLDTNVNTISNDTNICFGDSTQLFVTSNSVTSNLDVPTFMWSPANSLNFDNIPDPVAFPQSTTTYYVTIRENACFTKVDSVTVFVQPQPVIKITPPSPISIIAGTPTVLTATAPNVTIAHYMWQPSNTLNCDTCYDPTAIPKSNTTYTVTITSIYGCVSTDTVTIDMACDKSEIFIPNTFTPNGDGVNDRFFVSGKGISQIINFSVFNRWGQEIFEAHNIQANDPGAGWDGTFKGLVLEPDVFIYIVDAQCELSTTPYHYQGDVSIVK